MMFDILIIYCYIIDVDKLYLTQGGLKLRDKALIKYILEHVGSQVILISDSLLTIL